MAKRFVLPNVTFLLTMYDNWDIAKERVATRGIVNDFDKLDYKMPFIEGAYSSIYYDIRNGKYRDTRDIYKIDGAQDIDFIANIIYDVLKVKIDERGGLNG